MMWRSWRMSMHPQDYQAIPAETARVAHQVFPKGNPYVQLRDRFGVIYQDAQFCDLFCQHCGQAAYSPGQLALVTVMQFMEGLSDRQAAEAVRSRIDWKYMLGLEMTDQGFDYSVLSEFRGRLIAGEQVAHLLNQLLQVCQGQGLVKAKGTQRTDSTHVLAVVRQLNRLELVGETLRQSLETLAQVVPDWLLLQVDESWWERYEVRVEQAKLAKSKPAQAALLLQIGCDGHHLLAALDASEHAAYLASMPALQTLRQVWLQQYRVQAGQVNVRQSEDLPAFSQVIKSPYDTAARNRTKRQTNWTGYSVHLSETCDLATVNLITHVHTTPATMGDSPVLPEIHQALQAKALQPRTHLVDGGYFHSQHLVSSAEQQIDLVVPTPTDRSWAAQQPGRFTIPCFTIDWSQQTVTCPMGKTSISWIPTVHSDGDPFVRVNFSSRDCRDCAQRADCLSAQNQARHLNLLPQPQFEALQSARVRQSTPAFQALYRPRAGVEGTISQAVRAFELRRSRYIGLAKTHLQQVATATAINFARLAAHFQGLPKAQTRISHFAKLKPPVTNALG
jgi:transposase